MTTKSDKMRALETALGQIERQCGKGAIMKMGADGAKVRIRKCGFCMTPCAHPILDNVQAEDGTVAVSVARQCWGYMGTSRTVDAVARSLTSDYGLNGWEITYGMIPWLQLCKQHGLIDDIDVAVEPDIAGDDILTGPAAPEVHRRYPVLAIGRQGGIVFVIVAGVDGVAVVGCEATLVYGDVGVGLFGAYVDGAMV